MRFGFLRFIDLLATPYDFNVGNMSVTGGCISLLVILLTIAYTSNYYIKLSTVSESIYTGTDAQQLETIHLTQQTIAFALELTKTKGDIISYMEGLDQYFTISATLVEQTREQGVYGYNRIYTQLTPSRCSQQYIEQFNFKSVSFTQQQLDNFICFDGTYYLNGQFYDPNFTYIKLDVIKCSGHTCKSDQEIFDFLDGGVDVDLFIKDANVKSKFDSSNPAEVFPTNIYWRLTTSVGNNEDIFISPDIPFDGSTVNNRLYSSSKVTKSEGRQVSFDLKTVKSMCTFYLRTSNGSNNYFIKHTSTLTLVLTSISEGSGLALAIITILKLFYKYYCQHKTFEVIMNTVFKFDLGKKKDRQGQKIEKIDQLFEEKLTYSYLNYIWFSIKNIFKKLRCFKVSFSDNDKKIILAQFAQKKLQCDLDLAQIVKKLYEIDFLKLYLFDGDQLKLFNTFCQPIYEKAIIQYKSDFRKLAKTNFSATAEDQTLHQRKAEIKLVQEQIQNKFQVLPYLIPIEIRLARISQFFKSKTKIYSRQSLLETYEKIEKNKSKQNQDFIKFLENNNYNLYKLIKDYKNEQEEQASELYKIIKRKEENEGKMEIKQGVNSQQEENNNEQNNVSQQIIQIKSN